MSELLHSRAAIARRRGVSTATVTAWISAGLIPVDGPWTLEQADRPTVHRPSMTSEHGSASAWRYGCRCEACSAANTERTTAKREAEAREFWRLHENDLLDRLRSGSDYGEALRAVGVSPQRVTAHRSRDEEFAARFDDALMTGRNPGLRHGHYTGWRSGCRCPECRAAHDASR